MIIFSGFSDQGFYRYHLVTSILLVGDDGNCTSSSVCQQRSSACIFCYHTKAIREEMQSYRLLHPGQSKVLPPVLVWDIQTVAYKGLNEAFISVFCMSFCVIASCFYCCVACFLLTFNGQVGCCLIKYTNFSSGWEKSHNRRLKWTVLQSKQKTWYLERHVLNINPLTPNDHYKGRTALLTSKRCILYIYWANIGIEYFKHGIYSLFLSLQNAVCFIILMYLFPVLFTFYIQGALKLKKIIPAPNG